MKRQGGTVVITGASSGIGRAIAEVYAREGRRVVLAARREALLAEACASVKALGGDPVSVTCDITVAADRERLLERATEGARDVDVLVNNAGRGLYGTIASLKLDDVRSLFELNLLAPIDLTRLFLPSVERASGAIVFISSVAGVIAAPRMGAYAASKFALEAVAMALRAELSGRGSPARVVVSRPGITDTPFPYVAGSTDGSGTTRREGQRGMSPELVARDVARAVARGTPVTTPGAVNRAIVTAGQLVPFAVRVGLTRLARRPPAR